MVLRCLSAGHRRDSHIKESFVSDLDSLAACCRQALMDLENKRKNENTQDSFFKTEPETGEIYIIKPEDDT